MMSCIASGHGRRTRAARTGRLSPRAFQQRYVFDFVYTMEAPIEASQHWNVERTNARHNAFNRLQRCHERRERVIDAFFDLAGSNYLAAPAVRD
jgi:hypothetical protein